MKAAFDSNTDLKMLFICSPGNPTGTLIPLDTIQRILENPAFKGVVVVDEAYIDFAPQQSSAASLVNEYANVCVTQTLSKGFGLAAIRCACRVKSRASAADTYTRLGYLLAPPPLVQILTNTKAPYNISVPTASLGASAFSPSGLKCMSSNSSTLNANRSILISSLSEIKGVGRILGSNHANFVLVEILDEEGRVSNKQANEVYKTMAESRGVVVRFRGSEKGCEGCLRITVGTEEECMMAVKQLRDLLQ
jgi:histidinol-phosphate aminotransferase